MANNRTDSPQIQNKRNFYFDFLFDPSYLQTVCRMFRQLVESTFNQPAFRTYSQSVRHGISAVLTLPAIFYHTIEFLADRRRFNPFTKKKSVESFVYPSRGIRRGPETNKQYPSISRTDIAIHGDECSYCHPCFLKIAKFS